MKEIENRHILAAGGHSLDCRPERSGPAHVMGILNVTPDSFSDGGEFMALEHAIFHAEEMAKQGAVLIDIGGASSRPRGSVYGRGAEPISVSEETGRIVPVIEELSARLPNVWISVDTIQPAVADRALSAGAHMLNDITGLRIHPELADIAASHGVPLVLMHSIGSPGDMPHIEPYDDVIAAVLDSLSISIGIAQNRGVSQLVIDPGFGFGKSTEDNLRLIKGLDQLGVLGYPTLVGVSRKSTIGSILGSKDNPAAVHDRLYGSLGVTAAAAVRGAQIVRTHDVRETVEMLRLLNATLEL